VEKRNYVVAKKAATTDYEHMAERAQLVCFLRHTLFDSSRRNCARLGEVVWSSTSSRSLHKGQGGDTSTGTWK